MEYGSFLLYILSLEMTLPAWKTFLTFEYSIDGMFRALSIFVIAVTIVKYSTLFEEPYSKKLTDLYIHPWWRFLVVLLLLSSALWCPRVSILVAVIVFFYLSDMNTLITPIGSGL